LKEQVKRNMDRFPGDFMFRLNVEEMNIFIMRAFVKLRELLATHKDLAEKIQVLEKEQKEQGKDITTITIAMNKLLKEKNKLPSAIGFVI